MRIPLYQYAKDQGKPYSTVYDQFKRGLIKGDKAVKGQPIMVDVPTIQMAADQHDTMAKLAPINAPLIRMDTTTIGEGDPIFSESLAASRRNKSATIERADHWKNIEDLLVPYRRVQGGSVGTPTISLRDAIILCQKAYYGIWQVNNAINVMTDFANTKLFLEGGTARSRTFFDALFDKINMWDLKDQFFREAFRSGNVFLWRFDSTLQKEDAVKLAKTFGCRYTQAGNVRLPSRYVLLNPAEVAIGDSLAYFGDTYYKQFTDYELSRLRNPRTDQDREVLDSLSPDTRKQISARSGIVLVPLPVDKVTAIFYRKQDYEPFAVPMVFPVLDQISYRKELEKMDAAIARTWQQIVLLVTTGAPPDQGGINKNNLSTLQDIFKNQSVGRVLVADYTTKVEWKIPAISDILDPKKYSVIDEQIREGLGQVLIAGDKFANQSSRIQVFIERLRSVREMFLNNFLVPEMDRISKELGFRDRPTPKFEEPDMQDPVQLSRIYVRLVELGVLTPEEGIKAIESGKLPTPDDSIESQKRFKDNKNNGLYQPLIGAPKQNAGRPAGTNTPQSQKSVSPIGTEGKYSLSKIVANLKLADELLDACSKAVAKKLKVKTLNETQSLGVKALQIKVMSNEPPERWINSVAEYLNDPNDRHLDRTDSVIYVMNEYQVNEETAAILIASGL